MTKDKFIGSILIITLFILSSAISYTPLLAQNLSPTETMLQANQLYEAGQYDDATQLYQQLIESGLHNNLIYYNLGNVYFKQGDFGRAILNYRRAQRFSPRDPDIRANLQLAQSQTTDQLQADTQTPLSELVALTQNWLTLNEMAWLSLGLWFLCVLLIIVFSHSKSRLLYFGSINLSKFHLFWQYSLTIISLLFLISITALGSRLYLESTRPTAVIIVPEVNINSGPGEQYITEFSLHSGTEVSVIEQRNQWLRLTLPGDQLQGWVKTDTIELIQITE